MTLEEIIVEALFQYDGVRDYAHSNHIRADVVAQALRRFLVENPSEAAESLGLVWAGNSCYPIHLDNTAHTNEECRLYRLPPAKRVKVRALIQKYVDKCNPYPGEVEQTLEAIERVYHGH